MADDTPSSPEPSTSEPSASEASSPEPADPTVETVQPLESVVEEPVEQSVEQAPDAVMEQVADMQVDGKPTPGNPTPDKVEAPTASQPVAAPPEPSVATTLIVEPTPAPLATQVDEEGGEWELLLQKLRHWLNQGELQNLWTQARKPVTLLAALVGLLLVLRVYSAVLGALDSLPLVPGLLELAGVVWTVRYGVPKLLRSSEREQLLSGLTTRWKAFRGKAG